MGAVQGGGGDVTGTEKVIEGFKKLREYADSEVHPVVSPDNWNIYSELRDLIDKAEKDTLALLKAQEPRVMTLHEIDYVLNTTSKENERIFWAEVRSRTRKSLLSDTSIGKTYS